MKKIALITGVEGFIGSHMAPFLEGMKWEVIGSYLGHNISTPPKLQHGRLVQCDLRNAQRVAQILTEHQPTHVFHLAAQSLPTISWSDPVWTFESNIMGSLHLFEAVRHMKHRPVIVSACSSAEYGPVAASALPVREEHPLRPLHPYGISKVCLDLLARQYFLDYGIPSVSIRLFNTTGPGKTSDAPSDFVRQIVKIKKGQQRPVIEVGNTKPRRAFLDVEDAVRGFHLAALKGRHGESYNLCAAPPYRISEILRRAIRLSGVSVKVSQASHLMRPSDEKIIFGSTAKFRKDTGWVPLRSLDDTLLSMLRYWDEVL
jgi:GDP-4-dehydro-6-deoxy-D-mannose reductase